MIKRNNHFFMKCQPYTVFMLYHEIEVVPTNVKHKICIVGCIIEK